ncbi:MAG: hypothetical protein AAF747_11040 [Planctomycetota bacterium]
MLRTVLLRHTLTDGSAHFDWMLDLVGSGDDDTRSLRTFRVALDAGRPDRDGAFEAELIPDHRRRYLWYEGPISGDRGDVRREAEGTFVLVRDQAARLRIVVDFGAGPIAWLGEPLGDGPVWRFTRDADTSR